MFAKPTTNKYLHPLCKIFSRVRSEFKPLGTRHNCLSAMESDKEHFLTQNSLFHHFFFFRGSLISPMYLETDLLVGKRVLACWTAKTKGKRDTEILHWARDFVIFEASVVCFPEDLRYL